MPRNPVCSVAIGDYVRVETEKPYFSGRSFHIADAA